MTSSLSVPQGIYQDRLVTAQGQMIEWPWRSNLVVDRCRYLIAGFMCSDEATGIQQIQVGRGLADWDTTPPDPPARTAQQLTDPAPFVLSIESAQIEYLDAAASPTPGPTSRIQVTIRLEPGQPPIGAEETTYPLREFGLFGSFGGEGYMINYVRHPVIHKQPGDTLVRTIRLGF